MLAELERVADYLVLMSGGRVQVAGEVDDLLASHELLSGPAAEAGDCTRRLNVIHARRGEALVHLLVRNNGVPAAIPPGWESHPVSLEELTLAYMRDPAAGAMPGRARAVTRPTHGDKELSAATMTTRTETRRERCGRCPGGGWPGSPGGSIGSRWAESSGCSARLVRTWRSRAWPCMSPTPPSATAGRQVRPSASRSRTFLGYVLARHGMVLGLFQVIPALIGAFAGAPLLARELETGTFRYAWTQGFGRSRWTIAKLVPLAVVITLAAGAFSGLVSWYVQPIFGAGDNNGPLYPTLFDLLGVALAAWTLTAFAIGVLAGFLIRRVIPAMVATIVAWVGLAFVTGGYLRGHYTAPVVTTRAEHSCPGPGDQPRVVRGRQSQRAWT